MGDVINIDSSRRSREKIKTPEGSVEMPKGTAEKKKVNRLQLDSLRLNGEPRIDLMTKKGEKVGQAEYTWVTEPDMLNKANIRIHEADQQGAEEVVENIGDEKKAEAIAVERLERSHLDSMLVTKFMEFKGLGGEVLEAKGDSIYFDDNTHPVKTLFTTENALQRNFIIPESGSGQLEKLMVGDINVSIGEAPARFAVKRNYGSNILKDNGLGFTVSWVAKTSEGDVRMDLNFLYGREQKELEEEVVGEHKDKYLLPEADQKLFQKCADIYKANGLDPAKTKNAVIKYILDSEVQISENFYNEFKDSKWIPSKKEVEDAQEEAKRQHENLQAAA